MGHVNPPSLPAMLTSCPDCGREISRLARHCVHCGRPWPVRHPLAKAIRTGILLILALGAGSAAALYATSRHPETPKLNQSNAGAYTDASIRPATPPGSGAGSEHR